MSVLTLPRLGETMEEGRVVAWLKQPGEAYRRGETLLEVETDKTVVEVPALADGVLVKHLVGEGDTVAIDAPIAEVEGDAGADKAAAAASAAATAAAASSVASASAAAGSGPAASSFAAAPRAPATPSVAPSAAVDGERRRATPRARALARAAGLDLAALAGTGRRGRVTGADVEAAATAPSPRLAAGEGLVATQGGAVAYRAWPARRPGGLTAVLIHGLFADASAWVTTARALARAGVDAVAFDLPGHGRTTARATTPDAVAALLAEAIARTVAGPIHLVAHSYGAVVAVALAETHELDIERVSLIAPAGLGREISAAFLGDMLAAESDAGVAAALALLGKAAKTSPAFVSELRRRLAERRDELRAMVAAIAAADGQAADIAPALARLACPVRIVFGRDDAVIPWQHALAAPPSVALHLVPGAGHMPHWSDPALLERILAG